MLWVALNSTSPCLPYQTSSSSRKVPPIGRPSQYGIWPRSGFASGWLLSWPHKACVPSQLPIGKYLFYGFHGWAHAVWAWIWEAFYQLPLWVDPGTCSQNGWISVLTWVTSGEVSVPAVPPFEPGLALPAAELAHGISPSHLVSTRIPAFMGGLCLPSLVGHQIAGGGPQAPNCQSWVRGSPTADHQALNHHRWKQWNWQNQKMVKLEVHFLRHLWFCGWCFQRCTTNLRGCTPNVSPIPASLLACPKWDTAGSLAAAWDTASWLPDAWSVPPLLFSQ